MRLDGGDRPCRAADDTGRRRCCAVDGPSPVMSDSAVDVLAQSGCYLDVPRD
ncbi:hypothetical protein [Novosphingobium sp.]|uniref:hypothetical protein n=1 Tax=Novosphingobium sp. TaxID=1874826 RepID=UPI003B51E88E